MLCGALQTNTQNTANLSSGHRQTILMTNTVHKASSYLICTQSAFTMPAMISGALSVVSLFRPTLELNVHCQWWYLTTLSQQMLTAVKHVADDNFSARCYACAVYAMACVRPSVRLSVRLSQVGILLKRLNVGSHKQHHTSVFWRQRSPRNSTGITPYGGAKCRWSGSKSATFDK